MSTRWGFVCVSHDPELGDHDMVGGSGDYGKNILMDLWSVRATYAALNDDIFQDAANGSTYTSAVYFLRQHPRCVLVIESEYGDRYDPVSGLYTQSERRT